MDGTEHTAFALAAVGAVGVYGLIVRWPAFGAYAYLAACPLIVGFARGDIIGSLRPNEALLIVIAAALGTRAVISMLGGNYRGPTFSVVDLSLLLLASASSLFPIGQRLTRGLAVSSDDLLYSAVLWKYVILFRCFRAAVATPAQAMRCVWISMSSAAISALLGLLQVANLLGVPDFLHTYFQPPFEGKTLAVDDRATSTFGSSFAFADVMIINLLLTLALVHRRERPSYVIIGAGLLFLCGVVASGEFSALIGLGIAIVAFTVLSGRVRIALGVAAPMAIAAFFAFWSVLAKRLADFDGSSSALPNSWAGRWTNLQTFIFPELFSHLNWLWGVRPAARLAAPENWREWVYIESGYIWILWIGGLPFLAAFGFFAWTSGKHFWRVARSRNDAVGTIATAGFGYLAVLLVIMTFDPHLTLRGSADLFFPVLAMSFADARSKNRRVNTPLERLHGEMPSPAFARALTVSAASRARRTNST